MTGVTDNRSGRSHPEQRLLLASSRSQASLHQGTTERTAVVSRLIIVMAVLAVGSLLVSAGSAYIAARVIDMQHIDERRAALRAGVGEVRTMLRVGDAFDPRMIRLLEQTAGIAKLQFVSEPGQDGREQQPVMDMQGRIAGFLTWTPEFPLTELATTYAPAPAGIAFGLVLIAGYSLGQLRRARWHHQAQAEQARRAAETDPLTGLPTEPILLEKLGAILANRNIQQRVTVAVLELDGIDDARRHIGAKDCGNLIAAISGRLAAALPDTAILGRGGGERFIIVLPAVADVAPILRSAIEAVSQPHWFDSVVRVSAHAGFSQAPRDAVLQDELARAAGQALRAAAKKGPGAITGYDGSMDEVSGDIQFIRRELPRAISAGELELHYQPIVTPDGERITGVEALLRWTHPVRGAIPPATFIPVAEQIGLMDTLGEFVLRRALSDAQRWPQFYIGVNLSPVQVKDHAIVDLVGKTLAETGIEPSRLMLEITEGVLVDDPDEMIRRIGDLRALGVRIALDDFGSGYSNLGYLQRFPIDKLKIDRAFVTPLGKAANAGVMIQAIVTLGQALGLTVLVEGVETEEQRALLRMAGCDEMQGFLFARPAPAKAIDRLAAQHNSARIPLRSAQQQTAAAVLTG